MESRRMRIITVTLAWILIVAAPGCSDRSPSPTTAPTTRGGAIVDPLPRLLDNIPGENHFANIIQLTDGGDNRQPSWSPTGQRLSFSSIRPPHSSRERYVMAIDGSGLIQISGDGGGDIDPNLHWARRLAEGASPAVSADGSRICFHGYRQENSEVMKYSGPLPPAEDGPESLEIFLSNADGSGLVALTNHGAISFAPCFSPDGKSLIFSSNLGGNGFDLYSLALDGNLMEKVTTASGFDGDPRFSPDGRRLVFVSQRNDIDPQEFNIFVADWLLQEE